jgi:hypothetical protein
LSEPLLIGWVNIHKQFCDKDGTAIMALTTLQHKYGPELLELGVMFRIKIGKGKNVRVCAWPSKIRNWWTLKQKQAWLRKNSSI